MVLLGALAMLATPDRTALLTRAHAHNDYAHERPLFEALDNGFCSVEADVYLVEGELRVGHDRGDLRPGRTLQSLYLDPLAARVKANHGSVYPQKAPFTLLVDIKADGPAAYAELKRVLPRYSSMLAYFDGKVRRGAITIILSGERPIAEIQADKKRMVFIDGRMPDLESKPPASLAPLVSDSFERLFKWNGSGAMPAEERTQLRTFVDLAHKQGRRIRFWAAPDSVAGWQELYDAGVDLINTDHLTGLRDFLLSKGKR